MKEKIKNIFNSIKEHFNKILDLATLKTELRYLRREVIELKTKEKPYIDMINKLKSENRILKIQNTKLKKKVEVMSKWKQIMYIKIVHHLYKKIKN